MIAENPQMRVRTRFPGMDETLSRDQALAVHGFRFNESLMSRRGAVASAVGMQYNGIRDLYTTLGYKIELSFNDFLGKYERQDISRRIIRAYPDATWRGTPKILDNITPGDDTAFETDWKRHVEQTNAYHYLARGDRISGIGTYAVIFVGFNDGKAPEEPVVRSPGMKVLYHTPYTSASAPIVSFEGDPTNPRFGKPEFYNLTIQSSPAMRSGVGQASQPGFSMKVHWTRVLHLAEDTLESDVFCTPRLMPIYNRLDDLEKILGASAEGFWRAATPGIALEMDKDAKFQDGEQDKLQKQVDEYVHNFNRILKLKGIQAKLLAPNVSDPKSAVEVQMMMISGATGIPLRILTGSERGELASTQDVYNWNTRVDERRLDYAEPMILRAYIDMLVRVGVLAPPEGGSYEVEWPSFTSLDPLARAEVSERLSKAVASYVSSGADLLIPPNVYLTAILGFSEQEANEVEAQFENMTAEEREMQSAMQAEADVVVPPVVDEAVEVE